MSRSKSVVLAASLCTALLSPSAFAIPAAVQDFEDGTAEGWGFGGGPLGVPATPQPVVSGGAGGADDQFMQITSTGGSGPGSKLAAINPTAWGGNYTNAGLTSIAMDLRNFGATDLYIRLLLEDLSDLPQARYAITDAIFLPSGGDWTAASFSVAAADLIALQGEVATVLASVTHLRILGSADPDWLFAPGFQPSVAAILGVDNITPNVFGDGGNGDGDHEVPEPSSAWLVALGLLGLVRMGRKWRSVR